MSMINKEQKQEQHYFSELLDELNENGDLNAQGELDELNEFEDNNNQANIEFLESVEGLEYVMGMVDEELNEPRGDLSLPEYTKKQQELQQYQMDHRLFALLKASEAMEISARYLHLSAPKHNDLLASSIMNIAKCMSMTLLELKELYRTTTDQHTKEQLAKEGFNEDQMKSIIDSIMAIDVSLPDHLTEQANPVTDPVKEEK